MSKNPKNRWKLMKISWYLQRISSYLLNDLRKFNEIFRKDVSLNSNNFKSHKKPCFQPLYRRYIFQGFNQPGFVKKYKFNTVANMSSKLRVICSYEVSHLTLWHHYKAVATYYLRKSKSKDHSHIIKNNLDVTFFYYYELKCLRKKSLEQILKQTFPFVTGKSWV